MFRSTDGGATFQRVLFRDSDTGAIDVILDPSNPDTVYAALWEARQGPWENGAFSGPGSGLYKSTDGGTSWRQLTNGLPTFEADGLGRIGIGIAPSRPQRLFLTVDAQRNGGLYRSDDGGERWALVNADSRVTFRGSDFAVVKVHPTNPTSCSRPASLRGSRWTADRVSRLSGARRAATTTIASGSTRKPRM